MSCCSLQALKLRNADSKHGVAEGHVALKHFYNVLFLLLAATFSSKTNGKF